MKKVSIIIPIYNIEKYIYTCYESIKKQTYKNWEIIFVNDGSSDNSLNICEKIKKIDDRVKLISTKNLGVSHARNIGLDNSVGEYITFIDGDDYIEKKCLESLVNNLKETNSDMSIAKHYYKNDIIMNSFNKNYDSIIDSKEALKEHLSFNFTASLCFGLYKRKLIKDIRLSENIKNYEDWEFMFQLIQNSSRISIVDDCFYHYVTREGSASKSIFDEKKLTAFEIVDEVNRKIKDKKNYEKELITLKANLLLRMLVVYSSCDYTEPKYEKILKSIAKETKKNIFRKNNLDIKRKLYLLITSINPKIYKKLFKMKNGGKK